ncbi:MAG: SH3 domain-containing protein [Cyanobacteria bacterium]|nr:SH3 domain-containing protein [Cyanobacteriota bacterium]
MGPLLRRIGSPLALPSWRLAALLGLALIAPAALPAGGADRRQPELRRRQAGDPLLATGPLALRTAPRQQAPALVRLEAGEPLELLRSWWSPGGRRWLQVQTAAGPGAPRRGWLAG